MTPSPETPAQPQGAVAPTKSNRAAQIHSVRKHEFAMLRELIHKGQASHSGKVLAGLRGQAIRNKPPTAETLDKINAIEEQLEQLWRSRVTTAQSTLLGATPTAPQNTTARPSAASAPPAQEPQPMANAPMHTSSLASGPRLPQASAVEKRQTDLPESRGKPLTFDAVLLEAARLFGQADDGAAEQVLLQAIHQSQFPHSQTRYWALALLDIYRTHAETARFDWAVLEFVQWWSGKTPHWALATAPATPWKLQGRLQGPHALDLPEVDANAQVSRLKIDCTGLLGIDAAASKALRHWLRRAQVRNYAVHFEGVNLLVAALWEQIGMDDAAQWQLRPLP